MDVRGISTVLAGVGGIQQVAVANLRRVKELAQTTANALLGPNYIAQINEQAKQIQRQFMSSIKGTLINIRV